MFPFNALSHPKRGFTLIEILVVVAIIALLAAILFPVFSTAREKARTSSCASNMRQIGIAVDLYTQDNDEHYPNPLPGVYCQWPEGIYPYTKSEAVFKCPSNTKGEYRTGCPAPVSNPTDSPPNNGSYAMQQFRDALSGPQLSQFEHPSSTGTFHDANENSVLSHWGWQPTLTEEDLITAGLLKRHQEGNNVLFADGHVKWLTRGAMAKRSLWVLADTE